MSAVDRESIRMFCLSLPAATEDLKWETNLTFLIGKKIFAIMALDEAVAEQGFAFKCEPHVYHELVELEGIEPSPYLARYHWVKLIDLDVLADQELKAHILRSYDLVFERLPRKVQKEIRA